jgi:hypothetical protein
MHDIYIEVEERVSDGGLEATIDSERDLTLVQEHDVIMIDARAAQELRDFLNERYPK